MKYTLALFFVATFSPTFSNDLHPLSDEFIARINQKQSTWTAGRNFDENTSLDTIKGMLGVVKTGRQSLGPRKVHRGVSVPETFDAREQWKNCPSIGTIRDQSTCGCSWAFAATEAMTDRLCIHSNGTVQISLSAADLVSCCDSCGEGCRGGDPFRAWRYWISDGIVSGGGYQSNVGCKSYWFPKCEHYRKGKLPTCGPYKRTPECVRTCDPNSNLTYTDTLTYGKSAYYIRGEANIKAEIFKNGPVEAIFTVYQDFLHYQGGVYEYVQGYRLGDHAVKIIGWGKEIIGTPYWLIANSWNEDWGVHGTFKMFRGRDERGIESGATAGLPKL